jgi:hypothetical protein
VRPILLLVALLSACATVDATRSISAAETALEGARSAGAERTAPYELAGAEAYLDKAREENGRARYGDAAGHARKAQALAEEARRRAGAPEPRPEAR